MKASFGALLIAILLLIPTMAKAQITDKLVPHTGFMYEIITLQDPRNTGTSAVNFSYYTINLGTYYALAHRNDVVSVGFDAGVNFGINFPFTSQRGTVVTVVTQVPVFAMARVGALSTTYNQQPLGFGVGIGGVYTFFNDVADYNTGNKIRASYVVPAAVAELTLKTRGNTITVRGHFSLNQVNALLKGDNRPDLDYNMGNFGFGLIYSL